ncbi:RHS repeat-associated core domain-containing protein [Streptomyces purpureus]|uniref:RHS repeat-associated core domain-containing protein n=1 Tax=Streptomyces purpureus TaxID=1951 RepID=UPI0003722E9E|nr:RHS repeat-associated core domain-containing protein [Streptomyces purpureus]
MPCPPQGGTTTTKVTDADGRTTELLQYASADLTQPQKTTYTYGKYDEPQTVTDPAGNTWTYTFDSRGQKTQVDDPDKGLSKLTYDRAGRVTTTTDARGAILTTVYDELGRKTEVKNGPILLAKWTYDTVAKGQLTSATRYVDGAAYTTSTGGYTDRYQPTSTSFTAPTAAGALAGTYAWRYGYNAETGALEWTLNPAVGNVPSERVTTNYNSDDLPFRTSRDGIALVANTLYDAFARPGVTEFGDPLGKSVRQARRYDEHTGRLMRQTTDRSIAPQRIDDTTYAYDPAGNIRGVTTVSGQDATKSTDTQCFTTDPLGRLTEAWTAKADCAAAPSSSSVGGPDAYWHTYGYDAAGNRTQLVEHGTGALAGSDATTTYTHPAPKGNLPHAVQQAVVKGGANDGRKSTFTYDETGNTKKRVIGSRVQDLTWNTEGRLATLVEGGKTTSYLYDADGGRMVTRNADGSSILTLPNGDELKVSAGGAKTGTRYCTHNGETVAVRQGAETAYLFGDHQGTAMAAVALGTLAITRRKQLPFGSLRSEQSTDFGPRGFVGGTNDPTGLTHLGAREYDPTLGRFLSVDPIIDHDDPAQMNAYSYAHNNPVTKSDPDGLRPDGPVGGNGVADYFWAKERGMSAGYTYKSGRWIWHQTPRKDADSQKRYRAYRANPSHYKVYHYNAKAVAAAKAQAVKRAKERAARLDAERRKKEGVLGGIKRSVGNAWGGLKGSGVGQWVGDHWSEIKDGATLLGFAVCVVASAGTCIVAGAAIAVAKFSGDWALTGEADPRALAKDLAWTAVGGGSAAAFGRAVGGASSWSQAYRASPVVRQPSVRVVRPATALRHAKVVQSTRLNAGATYGNMSANAGFNATFCGAANSSLGAYVGVC